MTSRVRVKICGLTRLEDVQLAVQLGADAIGFVFWPGSPRVVNVEHARRLSRSVPHFVSRTGVFVDMPPRDVSAIAADVGLDVIQLHGNENAVDYASAGRRVIKSVSLTSDADIADVAAWSADILPIVDSHDADLRGGTGKVANWGRAAVLAAGRAIVLAGGLTAANVGAAMREVRPWAVDVSSGVEDRPGIKSAERLRAFFDAVEREGRRADSEREARNS